MALNLAVVKNLPLQIGSFFNNLKNKSAGSGASSAAGMSGSFGGRRATSATLPCGCVCVLQPSLCSFNKF